MMQIHNSTSIPYKQWVLLTFLNFNFCQFNVQKDLVFIIQFSYYLWVPPYTRQSCRLWTYSSEQTTFLMNLTF